MHAGIEIRAWQNKSELVSASIRCERGGFRRLTHPLSLYFPTPGPSFFSYFPNAFSFQYFSSTKRFPREVIDHRRTSGGLPMQENTEPGSEDEFLLRAFTVDISPNVLSPPIRALLKNELSVEKRYRNRVLQNFSRAGDMENFTDVLLQSRTGKATVLNTTLRQLYKEAPAKRDQAITTVIQVVLKLTTHPYQISSDELVELANCIITESRHFATPVLLATVESCIEYMGNNPEIDLPTRWIEILGKAVAVLASRDGIVLTEDTVDGSEYKARVIAAICRVPWKATNSASVILALREIPGLEPSDIDLILARASSSLRKLEPSSVPPVAYQLLHLAGDIRPTTLLGLFEKYFSSIKFKARPSDFEMPPPDDPKRKALGSTVYFFIQAARNSEVFTREVVKRVKASSFDPNLVMTPFILSVSLGLTSIEHLKPVIVQALKEIVVKSFLYMASSETDAWYSSQLGNVWKSVSSSFLNIMDARSSELDFMLDGMKDLAMALLDTKSLEGLSPFAAYQCKKLAEDIMTSIVKKNRTYLPAVINELLKCQKLPFIACLGGCLKSAAVTLVQPYYQNKMIELIHHLPRMTVETASELIKSMLPAFQLSNTLKTEMLMVLRKTIWKSVEARRITLTALILMLENSRIIGNIPKSQYSYSENSELLFSQATQTQIDVFSGSRTNEPLCFEIISILKRFFCQQIEVKSHLYLELYNVVRKNPELIGIVCSQLLTHVKTYINVDGELQLQNVLDNADVRNLKLKEKIGLLIQCICFVTLRGQKIFCDSSAEPKPFSLNDCEDVLDQILVQLLLNNSEYYEAESLKLSNVDTDVPMDFWDLRKARNLLMNEAICGIEAFIEFIALGGKIKQNPSIPKLFNKYQQLKAASQASGPKKGVTRRKKNVTTENVTDILRSQDSTRGQTQSQNETNTQVENSSSAEVLPSASTSEKGKAKVKLDGSSKKKVPYQYIFNLDSVREIISNFHNTQDVHNPVVAIRCNSDFEEFLLAAFLQKLEKMKNSEPVLERRRKRTEIIESLAYTASTLWMVLCRPNRLARSQELLTLDESSTSSSNNNKDLRLARLKYLSSVLEYLHKEYSDRRNFIMEAFLTSVSVYESDDYGERFIVFFEDWKSMFKISMDRSRRDNCLFPELCVVFEILDIHCQLLKPESAQVMRVKDWLENFVSHNPGNLQANCELVDSFMKVYITVERKAKRTCGNLLKLAKEALYTLEDIDNETEKFAPRTGHVSWLVNEASAETIVCSLGKYISSMFPLINHVLGRLKAYGTFIDDTRKLSIWRDSSCTMLEHLQFMITHLIRSDFETADCGDILLKVVNEYFITMTNITGELIETHKKMKEEVCMVLYERLVRRIGRFFKMRVEAFIMHVEATGKNSVKKTKKGTVPASVKQKFTKDAKAIPNVVYNIERYEQQVIALSKRTKTKLLYGTKASTARDFKIQMKDPVPTDTNSESTLNQSSNRTESTIATPPGPSRAIRGEQIARRSRGRSQTPSPSRTVCEPEVPNYSRAGRGEHKARRSRGRSAGPGRRVFADTSREIAAQHVQSIANRTPPVTSGILTLSTGMASSSSTCKPGDPETQGEVPRGENGLEANLPNDVMPNVNVLSELLRTNIQSDESRVPDEALDIQSLIATSQSRKRAASPESTTDIAMALKRDKKSDARPINSSTPCPSSLFKTSTQQRSPGDGVGNTFGASCLSPITVDDEPQDDVTSANGGCGESASSGFTVIPDSYPDESYFDSPDQARIAHEKSSSKGLPPPKLPAMRQMGLKRKRN